MTKCEKPVSLLSVLGSGGHTTEMLTLVESLDQDKYHRTFLHANTDSMSAKKLTMLPSQDFQVIFDSLKKKDVDHEQIVFCRFLRFQGLAKLVKVGFGHYCLLLSLFSNASLLFFGANQMWF